MYVNSKKGKKMKSKHIFHNRFEEREEKCMCRARVHIYITTKFPHELIHKTRKKKIIRTENK